MCEHYIYIHTIVNIYILAEASTRNCYHRARARKSACGHQNLGTSRCRVVQCVAVCCSVLQLNTAVIERGRARALMGTNTSVFDDGVWCSVVQCVAVCCSVLQCVAVCYNVLQCVVVHGSALQCIAACYRVVQCVAVCFSVLQCMAVRCNVLQCVAV